MKKGVKIALSVLAVILTAVMAIGVVVFSASTEKKMDVVTDYVVAKVNDFEFEPLIGRDPVMDVLDEKLGNMPETEKAVYGLLKSNARDIKCETVSADEKTMQSKVRIEYNDGSKIVDNIALGVSDYLTSEIKNGNIKLSDVRNAMDIITDDKLAEIITKAAEMGTDTRSETTATVSFEKQLGGAYYIPTGVSDEAIMAFSCGMADMVQELPRMTAGLFVQRYLETVFGAVQEYDTAAIKNLTGVELENTINLEKFPELSSAFRDFIAHRNAEMSYNIGAYDYENGTIAVEVTYSKPVEFVKDYATNVSLYTLTHLRNQPIPNDEKLAEIFRETEAKQFGFEQDTVSVTFGVDLETGRVSLPEGISEIFSADFTNILYKIVKIIL